MGIKKHLCFPFEKSWTASDSRQPFFVQQPNALIPWAVDLLLTSYLQQMKKTPLECLETRERGLRWPRGWQHPLPQASGDTCSLWEPAAFPLFGSTSSFSANEGPKPAHSRDRRGAQSSGDGHKEKLLPCLICFLPHTAGSWDVEILVLQHLDIK